MPNSLPKSKIIRTWKRYDDVVVADYQFDGQKYSTGNVMALSASSARRIARNEINKKLNAIRLIAWFHSARGVK
jgi:hypothetical protein